MAHVTVEREVGGRMMKFETGKIGRQASGCVVASYGETTVLVAAMRSGPRPGFDFFPLQCDYREKLPASGKFPGGFRKREGPPSEKEILTMRMMDRPVRPLFPDGYRDEVQVQAWVMSHDGQTDADMIACTACSAAINLTDAPFQGPVATVRVGRVEADSGPTFVLNPTHAQMEFSDIDLVLSGHVDGINMIEIGAAEATEADVMAAIKFGLEEGIKPLLEMQDELRRKSGAPEIVQGDLQLPPDDVMDQVRGLVEDEMTRVRQIRGKMERQDAIKALKEKMLEEHFALDPDAATYGAYLAAEKRRHHAGEAFRRVEKKIAHMLLAEKGIRADGRKFKEIRPLMMEAGVFDRTHGSALFQRGETQTFATCALGTHPVNKAASG